MKVPCPKCGHQIALEAGNHPDWLECASCQTRFARHELDTISVADRDTGATLTSVAESHDEDSNDGPRFENYRIIEEIARGGMGVVYRAEQLTPRRMVALKIIKSGTLADSDEIRRFETEANSAARLDHPNIVPIYEFGESAGRHFFSMGLVEGESLQQRLRSGPLLPREAAQLIRDLASAVQYAHDADIIHRDIKPANILLDEDGRPRITDFGLAKNQQVGSDMTVTGQIVGTPSFMPPEQALGNPSDVDEHADIYSLGATLYALLTGRPPFQSSNRMETLQQVIHQPPVPPRVLNSAIAKDLETICLKCLRKKPQDRYATAGQLADDLDNWLHNRPILARRLSVRQKIWLACKRRPAVAGTITTILITTLLAGGFILQQRIANARKIAQERETNDRKRAQSHIDNALTAPASALPYAVQLIEPLREYAIPYLKQRFKDRERLEKNQRLHAAILLTWLGDPQSEFLIDSIPQARGGECGNIVSALRKSENSPGLINKRIAATPDIDLRQRARYAIVALHLGDSAPAKTMCRPLPNPAATYAFVRKLSEWHGNPKELAGRMRSEQDADLLSAVIAGVGGISIEDLSGDDLKEWQTLLENQFLTNPHAGVHATAEWALRNWGIALPKIPRQAVPVKGRNWQVNNLGMTMVMLPPGKFRRGDIDSDGRPNQTVTLTRGFHIASHEVTVGMWQQFIDDMEYPAGAKPKKWPGVHKKNSPTKQHPVQRVNWSDCVLFCNWLSHRDGLTPCYKQDGKTWKWDQAANGYRLPTEAEWEYACRGGTSTAYCSGDDDESLNRFAVYRSVGAQSCGRRLPNRFGLFDMHGNVHEWCFDYWTRNYSLQLDVQNPVRSKPSTGRVVRGGSFRSGGRVLRSSSRRVANPRIRYDDIGFRVVRNSPD